MPYNQFMVRQAFLECGFRPLDQSFRNTPTDNYSPASYSRILPFYCCGYTDDFYLQITLEEFDFAVYFPDHANKETFFLVARDDKYRNRLRRIPSRNVDLPVLVCSVVVNRGAFPDLSPGGDEVEWLTKLTSRTKGIVHELLYADQYFHKYNWAVGVTNEPITIPNTESEEKLLCPDAVIEKLLHTLEQRSGLALKTEEQFRDAERSEAVRSYYGEWLKQFVVAREVCYRRTVEYLRSRFRSHGEPVILDALEVFPDGERNLLGFNHAMLRRTDYFDRFVSHCRNNGFPAVDIETIIHVTQRVLTRTR